MTRAPRWAAWTPDWTVAPAETLAEWMADQHIRRSELAAQMGVELAIVDDLLSSKVDTLTATVAAALERATHISARMWLALEANYRQSPAGWGDGPHMMLSAVIDTLVRRRRELGMRQSDVAIAMGVTHSAVAKIEIRWQLEPKFSALARYAKAVGMKLSLDLSLDEDSGTTKALDVEPGT